MIGRKASTCASRPDARVVRADAALGHDGAGLDDHRARAAGRARAEVDEVPSFGTPSCEEYWHIGEIQARLRNSTSRRVMGVCSSDMPGVRSRRPGAQAVDHDVEDPVDLRGIGVDRRDAAEQARDVDEACVRTGVARSLRALQQAVTGARDCDTAGAEDLRVGADRAEHLLCERALRGREADELAQPRDERVPGLEVGKAGGRAADGLDLVEVDGLEQMLARREVPVERADADLRPPGDVLERRRAAVCRERLARCGDELLVVAPRVRALGARREGGHLGFGFRHGVRLLVRLTNGGTLRILKRRTPPISSGGSLHFITTRRGFLPVTPTLVKHAPLRKSIERAPSAAPNTTAVLAIILATYLMIVLDISVIIAALPKIHRALDFSPTSLSWVQSAYTLSFGGLLLLGARAGDILGRRRMLVVGLALFTAASLAGGLAPSAAWLLGARVVQGVGAAIAAPSTLALLTTTFREGHARTRAIAYYSAVAGGGGSVGLVLGGILTDWLSWRWGLFINVPIGLAVILLAPRYLPETERRSGRFDVTGAVTSTVGMTALVYGFVRAASDGWSDRGTLASFAAGALLLAAFGLTETRAEQPITPLHLFASRQRSGAYGGARPRHRQHLLDVLLPHAVPAGRERLQRAPGRSCVPAHDGRDVRHGSRRPAAHPALRQQPAAHGRADHRRDGLAWLSRLSEGTHYFPGIAIPLALLGIGIGMAFTPLTAAGIAGVAEGDAGAASGLLNVAQQLGGSLGLGILITVFASATRSAAQHPLAGASAHTEASRELAHAVGTSLTGSAVLLALALAVVLAVMRRPAEAKAPAAIPSSAVPSRS